MKSKIYLFTVFFVALYVLLACKDEENKIGEQTYPDEQKTKIISDSSMVLSAYTYQSENYITTTRSMSNVLFGYSNDPILGSVQCDIITHVSKSSLLATPELKENEKVEIDSCVLYLEFQSSDGDTTTKQSFTVYELNHDVNVSDLDNKEVYKHTLNNYFDNSKPLKTFTYQPRRTWKYSNDTIRRTPISFHLPIEFAKRIMVDEIIKNGDTIKPYLKDSLFNKYILNGFYLKSDPNPNCRSVAKIAKSSDAQSDSTRMQIYYRIHKTDTVESHSNTYDIALQTKANIFYNNFNKSLIYNKMYTPLGIAKTDTAIYLKNNNGMYARIVVENIGNWTDSGKVALNKAAIVIPVNKRPVRDTLFDPIESIYVYYKSGSNYYALNMHSNSNGVIAIKYNSDLNGYLVVLTHEVQQLYRQKKWNEPIELLIKSATNSSSARSSIIKSPTNDKPMKLILTYTKY